MQLPRLPLHDEVQSPLVQLRACTPVVAHVRPQAPQFSVLVPVFVSQPSSGWGLLGVVQLPNPALQVGAHTPALHCRLWTLVPEQLRPQAPQWSGLLARVTSQPLSSCGLGGVLQSPVEEEQTGAHCPA